MDRATVIELPVGRHLAVDERGIALRATWRLDRGFVNLSLWRDDRCTETFHLTPPEAARLIQFLVTGLADAAGAAADRPALGPAADPAPRAGMTEAVGRQVREVRRDLADTFERWAHRLRP